MSTADAQVNEDLAEVYQARASLGLPAQLGEGDHVRRRLNPYTAAAGAMKALWALESCAQESRPTQRRGAAMRIANIE